MRKILSLFLFLFLSTGVFAQMARPVSIQGHRGARGYAPENTIPAFKKALEQGADTLELDVVVTKDGKLVVSHEAWFNAVISLDKSGNRIPSEKQREYNIYKMTYAEVREFDVGSIGNKDFPLQEKIKAVKPLLSDVFAEMTKFAKARKMAKPHYNIEMKTEGVAGDDVFHPKMDIFARLVYDQLRAEKMLDNVIIQSFDVRALKEMRKKSPKLPLSLLVANRDGVQKNLDALGFVPEFYSPNFGLVDAEMMAACRSRNVKIIPWTVNEPADLERMKKFEIDGIITDYPDRAVKIFRN